MLSSKTAAERIKAKADILMETDKYNMAINYYNSILSKSINTDLPERFMVMFITILVWLTQDCLNTTRLQQL